MTKRTITEMALEAGMSIHSNWAEQKLENFAKLVREDEREALEKIDWTALLREGGLVTWGDASELGDRVVAAIQERKQA